MRGHVRKPAALALVGVLSSAGGAPEFLAEFVTDDDREPLCAASREWMSDNDGDEHGDDMGTPVRIGRSYRFTWPTFPTDFTFAAGHRIGIVLVAGYSDFRSVAGTTGSRITLDTRVSSVRLPIVGGYGAAVASGGFARER